MNRKWLIVVLVAVMSIFLFLAACDKENGENDSSTQTGGNSYQNAEQEVSYQGIKYSFGIDGKGYRVVGVEDKNLSTATIEAEINSIPVTHISQHAFDGCYMLNSISIPDGIAVILPYAFKGCNSLESITLPDSVTAICQNAFENCTALSDITVGESVSFIGEYAFLRCNSITQAKAPATLFNSEYFPKSSLREAIVTNGEMLSGCFSKAASLERLTIGENVTYIAASVFIPCTSLESITVSENNKYYCSVDGILYNKDKTIIYTVPQKMQGEISIADSMIYINDYAFNGCSSLKYNEYDNALYLGDDNNPYLVFIKAKDTSITSCVINEDTRFIYKRAFYNCYELTEITIPDSVTVIGDNAFYNCSSLSNITIGNGVKSIGEYAFYGCSSLTDIAIPDSVTSIEMFAFNGCTALTSVTMGKNVIYVGYNAFSGCRSLQYNEYENALYLGSIDNPYFALIKAKNTSITTCIIHEDTTVVCDNAFENCSRLQFNEYENALYIGSQANPYLVLVKAEHLVSTFYYSINENTKFIHSKAFSVEDPIMDTYSWLVSITIPDGVISIGYRAFFYSHLKSVIIGTGLKHIDKQAFDLCPKLKNVVVNSEVLDIYSFLYISQFRNG